MESSSKTAREIYQDVISNPARKRFGFGDKAALVNIDPQKAYTRSGKKFASIPYSLEMNDTIA